MHTQQAHIGPGAISVSASAPSGIEVTPGLNFPGFTMRFGRNEEIFGQAEEADFIYKVVSGAVRTFRVLSDGRRQVVGFHLVGEVFGVERGESHRCSAEAVADCEVALVRRSVVNKASDQDHTAARWMWGLLSADLERLQDHMMLLGRKTAVERVAAFLLEMSHRAPCAGGLDLPMSRSDIADYLGLTIETVSRTLTQLERDRTIAIPSSRRIVLQNRAVLNDLDS
ncbi:MAG: helix-turn-helix domain-containing protein [Caulobacteraceae bacterium]|nr:helix-turn-helix domain-containing protein [Caulobacteraceae bacterium]